MHQRIIIILGFIISTFSIFAQPLSITLQKGHSSVVKKAILSHDGKTLFTASRDKTIKAWDVESGLEIKTFFGHTHTVNSLDISSDGKWLFSGSADGTAKRWNIKSGENVWTSLKSEWYVTDVALSPNNKMIAIGSFDDKVIVYSTKGDTVALLEADSDKGLGYGVNVKWSNDGKWLVVGEDNRVATAYDTKTWEQHMVMKPKNGWCGGCATFLSFHPTNSLLAKMSDGSDLILVDLSRKKVHKTLRKEVEDQHVLTFDRKGERLLTAGEDTIHIYDVASATKIQTIVPNVVEINDVIFSYDDQSILISGDNNKVVEIDVKTESIVKKYEGLLHARDKGGVLYDPNNYWHSHIANYINDKNKQVLTNDGQYLIQGKIGNILRMWEIKSGKPIVEYVGHEKSVVCFDLSPDEKQLISGGADGKVIMWDTKTGKKLREFYQHRDVVFDVCWSHDGTKIVSTSWDGVVKVSNAKTGEKISTIYWENVSAYDVVFSKDDYYLIVSKLDKTVQIHEVATGIELKPLVGHRDQVYDIITDSIGASIYTASLDGTIIKWGLYDGMIRQKIKHAQGGVRTITFAENKLFSAGDDRIIYQWNKEKGALTKTYKGHQAPVTCVNVSSDGKLLVSRDLDGVTKFWDIKSGEELLEHIIIDQANWMVHNPSGYFNTTEGAKKYIHYTSGMNVYLLDQFFEDFYEPQLIKNTFSYEKNARKKSIQKILEQSLPPEVKIAGIEDKDRLHAQLFIKIDSKGTPIKEVQLYHNGKRLNLSKKDFAIEKTRTEHEIYSCKLPLVSGHNEFTAKAINKKFLESKPSSLDILAVNEVISSTCYVLGIGIDKHRNGRLNLNYAKADAVSFVSAIENSTKNIFSNLITYQLLDEKATKTNILATIDTIIQKASINDVFIMYYAGHGSMHDGNFYFIPTNTTRLHDQNILNKEGLSAMAIQEKLTKLKALKQVVFIDACQSGGSVEVLAERGAVEEKAIAQLSRSAGIHILAAAGSQQYATEFTELGHGLFTYVLLDAINGKADGAPGDGKVTIYEMKSYLDDTVPKLSMKHKGKPQYPFTFSRGNDFPIGIKTK